MPSAAAPNPRAGSPTQEEIHSLLNYDDAVEDFLKDLPLEDNNTAAAAQTDTRDIDEEITVKKKRKAVPKLDEARLLSANGLPRLRKITKSRLKFRGKGHEFSDMSMLLDTYQLWLDELYPRAKFRDALAMVEKVGHGKGMQVRRRAWLDDTKPRARDPTPEVDDDPARSGALSAEATVQKPRGGNQDGQQNSPSAVDKSVAQQTTGVSEDAPDDDELDALLAEDTGSSRIAAPPQLSARNPFEEDDDDMDELDALLAEQPVMPAKGQVPAVQDGASRGADHLNDFADEEEAMAGMDMW